MRFSVDHDMHIHTHYSPCSSDARQTPEAILTYGLTNGLKLISLADHVWDDAVPSNTPTWPPLSRAMQHLPLPQSKACRLLFGVEADMNYEDILGISPKMLDTLDFMVISVDHLNLRNFTLNPAVTGDDALSRKLRYQERLHLMLDMDLPFYKTTVAHFSEGLVCDADPIRCMSLFTDAEYRDIFTKVRDRGMGVELNMIVSRYNEHDLREMLRPFYIAKELGCKFTLGGDAHHPEKFCGFRENAEKLIDFLELEEDDKLPFIREIVADVEAHQDFLGVKGLSE